MIGSKIIIKQLNKRNCLRSVFKSEKVVDGVFKQASETLFNMAVSRNRIRTVPNGEVSFDATS